MVSSYHRISLDPTLSHQRSLRGQVHGLHWYRVFFWLLPLEICLIIGLIPRWWCWPACYSVEGFDEGLAGILDSGYDGGLVGSSSRLLLSRLDHPTTRPWYRGSSIGLPAMIYYAWWAELEGIWRRISGVYGRIKHHNHFISTTSSTTDRLSIHKRIRPAAPSTGRARRFFQITPASFFSLDAPFKRSFLEFTAGYIWLIVTD